MTLALAPMLAVALAAPNAAKPDLRSGWPLDQVLPWAPTPLQVTWLLWGAVGVGVLAVAVGLLGPIPPVGRATPLALAAVGLLAAPTGSGDHLNYAAYGRILLAGGDPWVADPSAWAGGADPITSAVEDPWRHQPSVYGPVATALHAAAAWVGGDRLRLVVLAWQLVVVAAWLAVRWGLRTLVPPEHHGRVDVLWTLNPLLLWAGLLGAHVDTVATALVVLALVAIARWAPVPGAMAAGVAIGLAAGTKFTYAVAGLALLLAWGWRTALRRGPALAASAAATLALVHLGTGPHVYEQLDRARHAVGFASPWRLLLVELKPSLGEAGTRAVITVGAAVLAVLLAAVLAWATRPVGSAPGDARSVRAGGEDPRAVALRAAWWIAVLAGAYSLAAPYALPWYDLLPWAVLPAVAVGVLDGVLLARLALITAAYVPGRVAGMTPEAVTLTMGVRRGLVPQLQLVVWLATIAWVLVAKAQQRRLAR